MTSKLVIRKAHRLLGLFIGIQFLGWTISGLYFSWTDIDHVHGDHLRKQPQAFVSTDSIVSPSLVLTNLKQTVKAESIYSVKLISIKGTPVYQIAYHQGPTHHHLSYSLAEATTGLIRGPLTKEEAIEIAKDNVVDGAKVEDVLLLNSTDNHHEYRDSPLPAWAIEFAEPDCTVYVSAEMGTFQTIRNNHWRYFDFLWMFHTMDYRSRDNINNWLLRIFSIAGLITVASGLLLFFTTIRIKKK